MAIQANDVIRAEPCLDRPMRLDVLKFLHRAMALQTIRIVEPSTKHNRLVIGARRQPCQMPEPFHLRREIPGKTVVGMALVALIFRNPPVPEMPCRQSATLVISHVIDHRPHHVAAGTGIHLVDSFKRVIIRSPHRHQRNDQKSRQRRKLPHCCGRSLQQLPAKPRSTETKQRAEHADNRHVLHHDTFRKDTAVTLYSGSFDCGSTASDTARFTSSFAS